MLLTKAIHKAERQTDDRDVDSLNKTLYRHSKRHCISFLTGDTGPTENKNKHGVTAEDTPFLVQALNLPRIEIMSFEGNAR